MEVIMNKEYLFNKLRQLCIYAQDAVGTAEEETKFEEFRNLLYDNTFYLFEKSQGYHKDEDVKSKAMLLFLEEFKTIAERLVKNYDRNLPFENYLNRIIKNKIRRAGVDNIENYKYRTECEKNIIRYILDFEQEYCCTSDEMKENALRICYEKLKKGKNEKKDFDFDFFLSTWIDNLNSKIVYLDSENCQLKNTLCKNMYEKDDRFDLLNLKLNKLYKDSFTENYRKIFPQSFTSTYINNLLDELINKKSGNYVKKEGKTNVRTKANAIVAYPDVIRIKRDTYANGRYYCIRKSVFDYVLKNKELYTNKIIAQKFNVSEAYISKIWKNVWNKFKDEFPEWI